MTNTENERRTEEALKLSSLFEELDGRRPRLFMPELEDDDDKETVYVKKTTNFNVNLLKVSKKQLDDNTPTALNGAKFTLVEVNPENRDEVLQTLPQITTRK